MKSVFTRFQERGHGNKTEFRRVVRSGRHKLSASSMEPTLPMSAFSQQDAMAAMGIRL